MPSVMVQTGHVARAVGDVQTGHVSDMRANNSIGDAVGKAVGECGKIP